MDQQTADFYETNASSVAQRYEAVRSPVAHLFPLAFAEKSRVLDIGCGSGRDMAGLVAQGFSAFGTPALWSLTQETPATAQA